MIFYWKSNLMGVISVKKILFMIGLLSVLTSVLIFAQPIVQSTATFTTIFFEPDAGVTPFLNVINSAQKNLKVEVYVMTAKDIFEALGKATKRGVNVQVILTQHPYNMEAQAKYAYENLKSMGVVVKWAPTRFTYDHAKFVISDDSTAIFGTSNLTYSGVSQNFEANVLTKDPQLIKALVTVFNADWNNIRAGSVPREFLVLSPNSENDILWLIKSAKKTLKIAEEEVPEGNVFDAIKAAAKRGTKVQIVEPKSSVKNASGQYTLSSLAIAGVEVGLVKEPFIHAKMIISDDNYLFIGSENVSYTSMYKNREVGAILANRKLILQASSRFDSLWKTAFTLPPKLPTSQTAFLPQIVSNPYKYMGKLVKTVGTIEAVFGQTVFMSYARGNEIGGLELWLGHVANSSPKLTVGQTVRVIGSVETYKGQLEISAIVPPQIISTNLLSLPFQPAFDDLFKYCGLTVLLKGEVHFSSDGMYISNEKKNVKLLSLEKLPTIPSGTNVYVEGIVVNKNGKYEIAPTNFYSANSYVSVLEKGKIKKNPPLAELRKNTQLYYAQSITSTGVVSAVVSSSNAYIYSNGYGMRIYGEHGKIKVGDLVEVMGSFTSYNGSFEIELSELKIMEHSNPPLPVSIKTFEISKYPELLVEVKGKVSNPKKNSFYIKDSSGEVYVYLPKGNAPESGDVVKVIGIAVKYKGIYEVYAIQVLK